MILSEETYYLLQAGDVLKFVSAKKLSWPDSWRKITVTEVGINTPGGVKLFYFRTSKDTFGCWHVGSDPLCAWEWISRAGSSLSWINIWLE